MGYACSRESRPWNVDGARSMLVAMAIAGGCLIGCTGDARVELAVADVIHEIAGQLQVTLEAYDAEIEAFDEMRTREVARALAIRLAKASRDDEAAEADVGRFLLAMKKLRGDRRVATRRFAAADENVALLFEVSEGLRRLALDSMRFGDEGRRYLSAAVGKVQDRLSAWIRRKVGTPAQ